MRLDDRGEQLGRRVGHSQPDATTQERGREVALAVARQDDEGELVTANPSVDDRERAVALGFLDLDPPLLEASELRDHELAALEDIEEVVGQIDVALVDLVDEKRA